MNGIDQEDSKGKSNHYEARLVVEGVMQWTFIDYTEIFSPVTTKDSFRIIIELVVHFNLQLGQIDLKTIFLYGELFEEEFLSTWDFLQQWGEHLVCKLN